MEALHISATRNSPLVHMDPGLSVHRIVGVSIPENASEFYAPVIHWLEDNLRHIPTDSTFEFSLPYFNSSSLKAMYQVLMEIKKGMDAGKTFHFHWYVDDEDEFMQEAAETFSEMVGIELMVISGNLAA